MNIKTMARLSILAGATVAIAGANSPAQATMLNFSFDTASFTVSGFFTIPPQMGSFTLNTATSDTSKDPNAGSYPGAITNFKDSNGSSYSSLDLSTALDTSTNVSQWALASGKTTILQLAFQGDSLIKTLASDPASYKLSSSGTSRYGSFAVTGLKVTDPTAVPEPMTIVGGIAALSSGLLMKRKQKRNQAA